MWRPRPLTRSELLERVLQTCVEMMADRGYAVVQASVEMDPALVATRTGGAAGGEAVGEAEMGEAEIDGEAEMGEAEMGEADGEDAEVLHVRFHSEDKIGVKPVRQLQADMEANGVAKTLLVSAEGPTPFTRKEVAGDKRLEFWTFAQLAYNVTRFHCVPKHTLMSREEADALRRRYHVASDGQWPKLLRTDPIARYYDFLPGRLVRIDRTFGQRAHLYYRLVV